MTKPIISLLLLLLALKSHGQISDLSVIASSGSFSVVNGLDVSWTVGESFIGDVSNSSYCMAQGFHQGAVAVLSMDVKNPRHNNHIVAYPNPTRSKVTINLDEFSSSIGWKLDVLSMDGKTLHKEPIESASTNIDFSSYRCGSYLIKISNNTTFCEVFTIIKQ